MTATTAPTPVSAALTDLLDRARPASSLAAAQPLPAPTFPRWKGPAAHLSNAALVALVALLAVLAALVAPGLDGSPGEHASGVTAASAEAPPGSDGIGAETRVRASSLAVGTRVGPGTAVGGILHQGSDVLYDQTASGWLVAPRPTSWFGRSVDDLSAAAGVPGKGDLSAAGHALTKHATGQRAGSGAFPALRGGPGQINELAQFQVDDILTYPGSQFTQRTHPTFGNVLDVVAPDGRGVRFASDGRFIGFLEP